MNLANELLAKIKEKKKRILVIGDILIDQWAHGRLESCQDYCPKFVVENVIETPGGAANAGTSIVHWGVDTDIYGHTPSDRPIKRRYVQNGKIVFRADSREPGHISADKYTWMRTLIRDSLNHCDGVLLSDYDKGFLTPEFIEHVAELCRDRGVPCVADCKRAPNVYDGCIIKGNDAYLTKWHTSIQFSANVIITNGADNPIAWDGGSANRLGYDLPPVKCVNHVGAGDCFAAHLTLALAYGFLLTDAAALAHSAGRIYVQHPHNRPPKPEEIAADLTNHPRRQTNFTTVANLRG